MKWHVLNRVIFIGHTCSLDEKAVKEIFFLPNFLNHFF